MITPPARLPGLLAAFVWALACGAPIGAAPRPVAAEPGRAPLASSATNAPARASGTRNPIFWVEAPIAGDPSPIHARVPGEGVVVGDRSVRVLRPAAIPPRRVGIQVGHWNVQAAPAEFPNLRFQGGASFDGIDEVGVNLDIARRVAAILRAQSVTVDVLPAVIPPGYLADAFVSLHADADELRQARGFKIAHGFYRGRHEARLVDLLTEHYGATTAMPWDPNVTGEMTDYYAFAWWKYEHSLSPHTPAALIEMGFISQLEDRAILLGEPDRVAGGIAEGVLRFLASAPRAELFADEIFVPTVSGP